MSVAPGGVGLAEARVAVARARVAAQAEALGSHSRRLARSPVVIGGVAAAAAAVIGLVAMRRKTPQERLVRVERAAPATGLWAALRIAQALLPLAGAAATLVRRLPRKPAAAPAAVVAGAAAQKPLPVDATHDKGETPPPLALRGNWLAQQWQVAKAAVGAWIEDYAPSMGAAISYYTLFSLAPLLIVVIAVAGLVFGQDAAQGEIVAQLRGIMGEEGAVAIEGMLKAAREPAKSTFASIAGIAVLLVGATAVFAELQSALDRIWRVPAPKDEGIWALVRTRLLSFGLVLGLGFLLSVSLVASAALSALGTWWGGWFGGWEVLLQAVNFAVSLGLFTLLFAMIYKLMPRAKIAWRDVWTGAAVTAVLFTVGKLLIGLYLGKSGLASGFGAAGSLVVLLAWVYYSAQIFLLGAEYTWIQAKAHGALRVKAAR